MSWKQHNLMKILVSLILMSMLSISTQANDATNVGIVIIDFKDKQRKSWEGDTERPILTHMFYPTLDKQLEPLMLGPPGEELFFAGNVVWNAKPSGTQKRPLIVLSHGTGGSALQMFWLAQALVKNGYIVAGVNHHGNTAAEPKQYAQGYILWWERARDLSVVIEQLPTYAGWADKINPNKIGVAGFSLGGYTALSSVGGITDKSLFEKFCDSALKDATCKPQAEFLDIKKEFEQVKDTPQVIASLDRQSNSYKIDNVKGAFVIAPAVVQAITADSLRSINVPVSIIVGEEDTVVPAKTNAQKASTLIRDNDYTELSNVTHYTFLSECTKLGRTVLTELCIDKENVIRNNIHRNVAQKAVSFFDSILSEKFSLPTPPTIKTTQAATQKKKPVENPDIVEDESIKK